MYNYLVLLLLGLVMFRQQLRLTDNTAKLIMAAIIVLSVNHLTKPKPKPKQEHFLGLFGSSGPEPVNATTLAGTSLNVTGPTTTDSLTANNMIQAQYLNLTATGNGNYDTYNGGLNAAGLIRGNKIIGNNGLYAAGGEIVGPTLKSTGDVVVGGNLIMNKPIIQSGSILADHNGVFAVNDPSTITDIVNVILQAEQNNQSTNLTKFGIIVPASASYLDYFNIANATYANSVQEFASLIEANKNNNNAVMLCVIPFSKPFATVPTVKLSISFINYRDNNQGQVNSGTNQTVSRLHGVGSTGPVPVEGFSAQSPPPPPTPVPSPSSQVSGDIVFDQSGNLTAPTQHVHQITRTTEMKTPKVFLVSATPTDFTLGITMRNSRNATSNVRGILFNWTAHV